MPQQQSQMEKARNSKVTFYPKIFQQIPPVIYKYNDKKLYNASFNLLNCWF